jgi:D-2-hydroxyacid dehydrogenase (NADP+)
MSDIKLVVMDGIWTEWLSHFESVSPNIEAVAARTDEKLAARIVDANVVFGRLPRMPFLLARQLKWVQSIGVGFETMLYDEMVDSDIVMTNTAGAFDAAMAEHALALILSWTRGIITAERNRQDRVYTREIPVSQIDGRRVCVLGLGTIGRNVSIRLHHMGMHVIAVDTQVSAPPEGVDELLAPDGMHTALGKSDFVVVALPLTEGTRGLIDQSCFASMPNHAYLVNVARGPIVNQSDLIKALQSQTIAGAGIDVFEEEPLPNDSPLWDLPNAVITPHLGGKSAEGYRNMREIFCENLRRYAQGKQLLNVVDKRREYVVQ